MAETATLRLAHRGDWRDAPENSLAAMQAALRIPGCDGLEFDVRCSSDDVPVLLHDATLERVQHVPLECVTLTAEELAEHGVPTLADVLVAVGCDAYVDVELKAAVPGLIDVLELERGRVDDEGRPTLRSAVISSFDHGILRAIGEQRPTWPRWLNAYDLSEKTIDHARDLGCTGVAAEWHAIDVGSLARALGEGLDVAAWTVTDPEDYRRLADLGVAAICVEGAALEG